MARKTGRIMYCGVVRIGRNVRNNRIAPRAQKLTNRVGTTTDMLKMGKEGRFKGERRNGIQIT